MKAFVWKRHAALAVIFLGVVFAIVLVFHLVGTLLSLGGNAFQIPDSQFWLSHQDWAGVKMVLVTEQLVAFATLWVVLLSLTLAVVAVLPPKPVSGAGAQVTNSEAAHSQVAASPPAAIKTFTINEKIAWIGLALFALLVMIIGGGVAWSQMGTQTLFALRIPLHTLLAAFPIFGLLWFSVACLAIYRFFSTPARAHSQEYSQAQGQAQGQAVPNSGAAQRKNVR